MARLWSTGYEMNSTAKDEELDYQGNSGPMAYSTTTVRSGTYAMRAFNAGSGVDAASGHRFAAADSDGPYFMRTYMYIAALPTVANVFFELDSAGNPVGAMRLTTTGTIQLLSAYPTNAQVGSDSPALSLGRWYRIELMFDRRMGSSGAIMEAKIDGTTFAQGSGLTAATGINGFELGVKIYTEADTTTDLYFDDSAVNDGLGSFQNSWCGDGSIVVLRPNAAGNNSEWTPTGGANYTNVSEVIPDDATTIVTGTSGGGAIDDYNIDATPAAITTNSEVKVVAVGVRYATTATNASFALRIKANTTGVVQTGTNILGDAVATYHSHALAAPRQYTLTLYNLPGNDNNKWRKSDLDVTQIGIVENGVVTSVVRVTAMWLLVEYSEPISQIVSPNKLRPRVFAPGLAR